MARGGFLEVSGELRVARIGVDRLLNTDERLASCLDGRQQNLRLHPNRLGLLLLAAEDLKGLGGEERAEIEEAGFGGRIEHAEQVVRVQEIAHPHEFSERELIDRPWPVEFFHLVAASGLATGLVEIQRALIHRLVVFNRTWVEAEALGVEHQRVFVIAGRSDGAGVLEELAGLLRRR